MARLVSGEDHHHHLELDKLHSTCKEWGVFQLVNHGVKSSVVEKLKNELEEFYNLPMEERMKYKIKAGEHEGYGNIGKEDGKRDWADRFYFITNPIHRRNPHLLPELPSSLRNILESYFMELQKIAMKLLSFIAKALEIDVNEMIELSENGMQSVRMTYYPPCPNLELAMGFAPHSDATLITILNQVNGVDGLHVNKDGVWLPLIFQPNALVVNIGDILEIFSNGVYHSIEHKATANMVKERITVAFFVNPKFEAEVGPSPSLVNPKNPPLFKRVGMEQYGRDYFVRRPHGKTYLQHMRIEDGQDNLNKTSYIEN
ncbi:Oxoglutarate/iron-dependent dioxygenase [Corchorus capsularis]|uniref:Oxoglutarate/iron-dependent dioxygenase n=1 Tax=Corchorus capsularis TaxID=210143 RepID=A0A1R3JGJ4_COCAP|nr:Oxoglutarate/iron-dependent dioxygenase [Corchorus capsularis]